MLHIVISSDDTETPLNTKLEKFFKGTPFVRQRARSFDEITNLRNALMSTPDDKFLLYIRDDSIPLSSKTEFDKLIKRVMEDEWDIYYLCKYMDKCEKYTSTKTATVSYLTTRTYSPQGVQAVLLAPSVRNKLSEQMNQGLLLKQFEERKMVARTCLPNFFEIDFTRRKDDSEILKQYPCMSVTSSTRSDVVSYVAAHKEEDLAMKQFKEIVSAKPEPKPVATTTGPSFFNPSIEMIIKWMLIISIIIMVAEFFLKKRG